MTNTKYNGWTNYATWRVNLEFFDGCAWLESLEHISDVGKYADCLKDIVMESMEQEAQGLALSYAQAFVNEVNWHEIASSMLEQYNSEEV